MLTVGAAAFRAAAGKRRRLTSAGYIAHSMRQMTKRQMEDDGLPELFSPHSFRVTVVTDLLNQNVPLEDVQYLAGHASPTTTRVYDRRRRMVSFPTPFRFGRVVSGDCSPETPTEPDVQIFRIRLFGPRFRYATFAGRMRGSGNG